MRQQLKAKSLFILWITGPRSSVRPLLTRAWWLSATGYVAVLEPPPGRGGRQWLGSLPRHSAGVGIPKSHCQVTRSTAILAHSIPSPSSHGSAMARTGRKSLIHTKSKKKNSKPQFAVLSIATLCAGALTRDTRSPLEFTTSLLDDCCSQLFQGEVYSIRH